MEIKLGFPSMILKSKQYLPNGGKVPAKTKTSWSGRKIMGTVLWVAEGILLVAYYGNVLRKLAKICSKKCCRKFNQKIFFHHNNDSAHSSHQTRGILREFWREIIRYPPYNTDLAPSDFFLFPKLNNFERYSFWDYCKKKKKTAALTK